MPRRRCRTRRHDAERYAERRPNNSRAASAISSGVTSFWRSKRLAARLGNVPESRYADKFIVSHVLRTGRRSESRRLRSFNSGCGPFTQRARKSKGAACGPHYDHPARNIAWHESTDILRPLRASPEMRGQREVRVPTAGDCKRVCRDPLATSIKGADCHMVHPICAASLDHSRSAEQARTNTLCCGKER
jgi:hypothetical protein